jgi:hypothetical protein
MREIKLNKYSKERNAEADKTMEEDLTQPLSLEESIEGQRLYDLQVEAYRKKCLTNN